MNYKLPSLIDETGQERYLACLPPDLSKLSFKSADQAPHILTDDQLIETDLSTNHIPILDQGTTNACTAYMGAMLCTYNWLIKTNKLLNFSPDFIYAQVNNNEDNGAQISDISYELMNTGAVLTEQINKINNNNNNILFKKDIPESIYQLANKYKLKNYYHCPTIQSIASQLSLNRPVGLGILIGSNFLNKQTYTHLDQDDTPVASLPNIVIGGHAILLIGLKLVKTKKYFKAQNSWSKKFGNNGYTYLNEDFLDYTAQRRGIMDAFAMEYISDDPDNNLPEANI